MSRKKSTSPVYKAAALPDPLHVIAQATAGDVGAEFLAALVRSMHAAMDVSVALITRGIGEPPVRARASFSWKKNDTQFPIEYDLEGTACQLVYKGQVLIIPEQLWQQFPRDAGFEGYCGVPLRKSGGEVVGHFSVVSEVPIRDAERTESIMRIFGMRVEAELQRLESEREREALVARLGHALERLGHQHKLTREANAFKTDALGMVAHDLRSPLAAIVSRADFIEQILDKEAQANGTAAAPLREKLQASCASIGRSADRMEQMIAGLLTSARTEARSIALRLAEIDLADAVRVAIDLNHAAAEAKKLRVTEKLAHAGPVIADEDRVIEAIDNLVSNAVKYSDAGGAITVATATDANASLATIRVSDRGQGLSEADIAQAFQRFQRLSAKPTAGEPSTGLGLAIVRAIAEAHGGTVDVASPGKNQGGTFTLYLPLAGPKSAKDAEQA